MTGPVRPALSVVLCTFRRPDTVGRALAGLLASARSDLEVVVADAGDPRETEEALSNRRDDHRWRIVGVPDRGLACLRNDGAAQATGDWIGFLDDDDWVEPGWVDAMLEAAAVDGVGLVSCGAQLVDTGDGSCESAPACGLGPLFADLAGNVLAGCWIVRRDLFEAAGGYLPGLMWSHQTELWLRLATVCREQGLIATTVDRSLTNVSRRPPDARRLAHPRLLLDGTRWILARHRASFDRSPADRATYLDIVGVNAARLDEWRIARRSFARSLVLRPGPRSLVRLLTAGAPTVARRAWRAPEAIPVGAAVAAQSLAAAAQETSHAQPADRFFLPWRYRENPPASADIDGTPFWSSGQLHDDRYQEPVYRWAGRLARDPAHQPVVDIGCGEARKLVQHVGGVTPRYVGVDQESGIARARAARPDDDWVAGDLGDAELWSALRTLRPGLVICSDVIEHVPDPRELLGRLRDLAAGAPILLSTPDRLRLDGVDPDGPPRNPAHIREWTSDELDLLYESTGLRVLRRRHLLPRAYSATRVDLNRAAYRALHLKAIPDRRSSLAVLLQEAPSR